MINRQVNFLKIRVFLFLFLLFPLSLFAQESGASLANDTYLNAKSEWGFLAGYGTSRPGWGETRTEVETIDVVYRYGYFLSGETGKSWYRGRPELLVEIPVAFVQVPEAGEIMGFNLILSRNFTSSKKVVPYVFAGLGLAYTDLDIPGLGSELNGTYQIGAGLRFFTSKKMSLDLNCRFHHLSNGDTADQNTPLNSAKILLGVSFYR